MAVIALGCSGEGPGTKPPLTAVTPATHTWFPLGAGASHALGRVTSDGTIACESCHPAAAESFKDIDCVSCHTHGQHVMGRVHTSVTAYGYTSAQCYQCHPQGAKVAFDHHGITDTCNECHDVGQVFAALPKAGFYAPGHRGGRLRDLPRGHHLAGRHRHAARATRSTPSTPSPSPA